MGRNHARVAEDALTGNGHVGIFRVCPFRRPERVLLDIDIMKRKKEGDR